MFSNDTKGANLQQFPSSLATLSADATFDVARSLARYLRIYLLSSASILILTIVAAEFLRRGNVGEFHEFRRAQFHLSFWILGVNLAGSLLICWYVVKMGWQNRLRTVLLGDSLLSVLPVVLAIMTHNAFASRAVQSFGLVLGIFVFGKCALWTLFACWNSPEGADSRPLRWYVFAISLMVFVMFAPWYAMTITPVADEVHYTLLTYSLIHDHDFDLANNYEKTDFAEQWPPITPELIRHYGVALQEIAGIQAVKREPHVVTNFRGQQMLWHDVGIPLLLVPGYALGKRLGVVLTLAVAGSFLALAMLEISLLLGARTIPAIVVAIFSTFTPPLYLYAETAFPEIFGSVGILWIALCFLRYKAEPESHRFLLAAGVITAILPWVCIRFWVLAGPLFLVFLAFLVMRYWNRRPVLLRNMALLGGPSFVGLAIFAWFDHKYFNTYLPNAGYRIIASSIPQFFARPQQALLGMFFDRTFGLLPTAPLYVAGVAGLLVLLRRDQWAAAALALPCAGYVGFMSFSQFWAGGWSPPGRYLIAALVLLLPAAALVLNHRTRWILLLPALWTITADLIFTMDPFTRWPSIFKSYYGSGFIDFLEDWMPLPYIAHPLGVYPSMLRNPGAQQYVVALGWLVAYGALACWLARMASRQNTVGAATPGAIP